MVEHARRANSEPGDASKERDETSSGLESREEAGSARIIFPPTYIGTLGFLFRAKAIERLKAELPSLRFNNSLKDLFAGTGLGDPGRVFTEGDLKLVEVSLPEDLALLGETRWVEPYRPSLHSPLLRSLFRQGFVFQSYPQLPAPNKRRVLPTDPDYFDHFPAEIQAFKEDFRLMKDKGIPYPFPSYEIAVG